MAQDEVIARAVGGLLKPVLAFCIRRSVRLRQILELVKVSLVEIGTAELERRGETVNASKIALMTGVHRKDIAELFSSEAPRDTGATVVRKIIGQWKSDQRFVTSDGQPRALTYQGPRSEFARLVRASHREVHPYSIIFELERSKAVAIRGEKVHLLKNEYVPTGKVQEHLALVSQDVQDLLRAAEENIFSSAAVPHLHLSTSYDNISPEALPEIRRWFMKKGAEWHDEARRYLSAFDRDITPVENQDAVNQDEGRARVSIGTFSFAEEITSTLEEPQKKRKRTSAVS